MTKIEKFIIGYVKFLALMGAIITPVSVSVLLVYMVMRSAVLMTLVAIVVGWIVYRHINPREGEKNE